MSGKQCLIYACRRREDRPCCAECGEKDCEDRCGNAPERCRAWYEPEARSKDGRRSLDYGRILTLYLEGLSQPEVAEVMGCSQKTVDNVLHRYNVHIRGRVNREVVAAMYRAGAFKTQIAEALGVSTQTVINHLKAWEKSHGERE